MGRFFFCKWSILELKEKRYFRRAGRTRFRREKSESIRLCTPKRAKIGKIRFFFKFTSNVFSHPFHQLFSGRLACFAMNLQLITIQISPSNEPPTNCCITAFCLWMNGTVFFFESNSWTERKTIFSRTGVGKRNFLFFFLGEKKKPESFQSGFFFPQK